MLLSAAAAPDLYLLFFRVIRILLFYSNTNTFVVAKRKRVKREREREREVIRRTEREGESSRESSDYFLEA